MTPLEACLLSVSCALFASLSAVTYLAYRLYQHGMYLIIDIRKGVDAQLQVPLAVHMHEAILGTLASLGAENLGGLPKERQGQISFARKGVELIGSKIGQGATKGSGLGGLGELFNTLQSLGNSGLLSGGKAGEVIPKAVDAARDISKIWGKK